MKKLAELHRSLKARFRRQKEPLISINDPDLRVVATAYDETEAASSALARATELDTDLPAVLRHHLALPRQTSQSALELLTADGWELRPGGRGAESADGQLEAWQALRVEKLDALVCSQQSSRMAGLDQRHGGQTFGWDALQPPPNRADPTK